LIQLKTYSEWSIYLEKYANGEDAVLEIIQNGVFEFDAGTTLRFYEKIQNTYIARKKNIFDKFNRELAIKSAKSNNDFIIIFRNLNNLLLGLNSFVEVKVIPEDLKKILVDDYNDYINDLKSRFTKVFNNNFEVLSSVKSLGIPKQTIYHSQEGIKEENINTNTRKIIF
jgi:hypothetical protein